MTDEAKKYVSIGLVVVCLGVAGTIFYKSFLGGGPSNNAGDRQVALLCTKCGGFEIQADEFRDIMQQAGPDMMMMGMPGQPMAVTCPKCSQKSCYMAQKCPSCENIFVMGQARDQNYPDRCPKCGKSKIEEMQQNR